LGDVKYAPNSLNYINVGVEEALVLYTKYSMSVDGKVSEKVQENFYKDFKFICNASDYSQLKKNPDADAIYKTRKHIKYGTETIPIVNVFKELSFPENHTSFFKHLDTTEIQNFLLEVKKESPLFAREVDEIKKRLKEVYGFCKLDDFRFPLGAYTIEEPALMRTRNVDTPYNGRIKRRIKPGDVVINCSECPTIPKIAWGEVIKDNTIDYLWSYNNLHKMKHVAINRGRNPNVWFHDRQKFDLARELNANIETVRAKYTKQIEDNNFMGVCAYFLDKLSIRPGTEKDESKDTGSIGLTQLAKQNIEFLGREEGAKKEDAERYNIKIKFTGKDNITYDRQVKVTKKVYNMLKEKCESLKSKDDLIFFKSGESGAKSLNEYLKTLLPGLGLTAKVFRTWKASSIFNKELNEIKFKGNEPLKEKKEQFKNANEKVAVHLNHVKITKKADGESEIKNSLETSKTNYIDPRITVSWCKRNEFPIESAYTSELIKKFTWAMYISMKWNYDKKADDKPDIKVTPEMEVDEEELILEESEEENNEDFEVSSE
jgi:DNA topoisomerase I